jgi:hypothetical protein
VAELDGARCSRGDLHVLTLWEADVRRKGPVQVRDRRSTLLCSSKQAASICFDSGSPLTRGLHARVCSGCDLSLVEQRVAEIDRLLEAMRQGTSAQARSCFVGLLSAAFLRSRGARA